MGACEAAHRGASLQIAFHGDSGRHDCASGIGCGKLHADSVSTVAVAGTSTSAVAVAGAGTSTSTAAVAGTSSSTIDLQREGGGTAPRPSVVLPAQQLRGLYATLVQPTGATRLLSQ